MTTKAIKALPYEKRKGESVREIPNISSLNSWLYMPGRLEAVYANILASLPRRPSASLPNMSSSSRAYDSLRRNLASFLDMLPRLTRRTITKSWTSSLTTST